MKPAASTATGPNDNKFFQHIIHQLRECRLEDPHKHTHTHTHTHTHIFFPFFWGGKTSTLFSTLLTVVHTLPDLTLTQRANENVVVAIVHDHDLDRQLSLRPAVAVASSERYGSGDRCFSLLVHYITLRTTYTHTFSFGGDDTREGSIYRFFSTRFRRKGFPFPIRSRVESREWSGIP